MLKHPATKYRPTPAVDLRTRSWPNQSMTQSPIWMSTDLRDGNQALFEPMDVPRKMRLFETLIQIGCKEIEVAFPAASQTDFDFTRHLIEAQHIPPDVTIEAITQARESLIRRTFTALQGARRAIVHLYNATAPIWRRDVLQLSRSETLQLAVKHMRLIRQLAEDHPETDWVLQYSPETFSATELDFSLAICQAVIEAAGATPERRMILNLPATVEGSTPNIFADQIEWMQQHLAEQRQAVILSVHPHNDRGTAVAAAELALLAGAERVEGCLFGNGERTGNVDLVTLALNLYTQGIDPGLDLSNLSQVMRTVEYCNRLPIHPRHPYAGDLVYTAFSGSHQDAIRKGLLLRQDSSYHTASTYWQVPYLPIDPLDIGRSYASIIRVNSQSGKGGIAYLLETHYGLQLPRRMQIHFSQVVQSHMDTLGCEASAEQLWAWLLATYQSSSLEEVAHNDLLAMPQTLTLRQLVSNIQDIRQGFNNQASASTALAKALPRLPKHGGAAVEILDYQEQLITDQDGVQTTAVIMETSYASIAGSSFGLSFHVQPALAALHALTHSVANGLAKKSYACQYELATN